MRDAIQNPVTPYTFKSEHSGYIATVMLRDGITEAYYVVARDEAQARYRAARRARVAMDKVIEITRG